MADPPPRSLRDIMDDLRKEWGLEPIYTLAKLEAVRCACGTLTTKKTCPGCGEERSGDE